MQLTTQGKSSRLVLNGMDISDNVQQVEVHIDGVSLPLVVISLWPEKFDLSVPPGDDFDRIVLSRHTPADQLQAVSGGGS